MNNCVYCIWSEECSSGFVRISDVVSVFNIFIPHVAFVVLRMKGYYLQFVTLTNFFYNGDLKCSMCSKK
jgi:hypothetical protein